MKLFRFGEVMKREYRGQRSPEAFVKYLQNQLVNPFNVVTSQDEMEAVNVCMQSCSHWCTASVTQSATVTQSACVTQSVRMILLLFISGQDNNRNMLVYVADENSAHYKNVLRAASQLRNDCTWHVMTGPNAQPHLKNGEDVVYFRQPNVSIHQSLITTVSEGDVHLIVAYRYTVCRDKAVTYRSPA